MSPEVQAELEKRFKEIFVSTLSKEDKTDCSKWLFDEEYEEKLVKSVLKEIFRLGLASCFEKDDACEKKETIVTNNGHQESYIILDKIILNDRKLFVLVPIKPENNILVFSTNKTDNIKNINCYLPFNIDDFFLSFYDNLK